MTEIKKVERFQIEGYGSLVFTSEREAVRHAIHHKLRHLLETTETYSMSGQNGTFTRQVISLELMMKNAEEVIDLLNEWLDSGQQVSASTTKNEG